jgi:hypothetical protein
VKEREMLKDKWMEREGRDVDKWIEREEGVKVDGKRERERDEKTREERVI